MNGAPGMAFCACCTPAVLLPQADSLNRPGLSAISYRIGTFATFRRALLESIAPEPRLAALTSRADDEYAVTLIELFSAVGDVLAFYNERIANELFLGTARERDSVLRLVRLIGYRLRPGLAATAMLSFTLDAGAETRIRKGFKVMSVPGQDEHPQIFETLEPIVAHGDLNEPPAFAPPVPFAAFAQGGSGGPIVARPESLAPGDPFVVFGMDAIEEKQVTSLAQGQDGERLGFDPPIQDARLWPCVARAAKILRRPRFFGHNAPLSHNVYIPANPPAQPWPIWTSQNINDRLDSTDPDYPLDGKYDDLRPGAQFLVDVGPGQPPRLRTAVATAVDTRHAAFGPIEGSVTYVTLRQTIRGRPALAAGLAGGHAVFALSGTGAALSLSLTAPRRWFYLESPAPLADLAITIAPPGRLDVLARGAGRTLLQRRWTGGWSGWVDHGGRLTGEPRPLWVGAALQVFARGGDFALWSIDVTAGTAGSWIPLGGYLTSPPAAVSPDGIGTAVLARGGDRALWIRRRDAAGWAEWESLGGTLASGPAVASTGAGRIDVIARGDAGNVLHRRFDGSAWSEWRDLGGEAADEPAIVAGPADRVDIFVRGAEGELRHIARAGATWSAWTDLGGKLGGAPSAIRTGAELHVYARGADGAIVQRSLTGAGWQAWASHGDGLGEIGERRATRIYEISAADIEFRSFDYPAAASGGQVALRFSEPQTAVPAGLDKLVKGRPILLGSGARRHLAKVAGSRLLAAEPGGVPDHLLVDFAPALPTPFRDAVLFGNIAAASHGETQPDEPLGHGNAAQPFQKFELQRSPVTYLPSATTIAGEAALEIRVNGEKWSETPSLYGSGPTERVHTARQSDEGATILTFGDGRTGARLPSGALNVVARYRKGLGIAGRMKAGQLSTPLERPPGLRAVVNPLAADGGADPESRDDARRAAPGTVRTFGRAVSLRDFEWIATTSGLVARAYVTWVWHQFERAVHLTVAAADGEKLSPPSLDTLYAALRTARDPNRELFLANLVRVPIVVGARLVADPAFDPDAVHDAARAALLSLFAFETVPLGYAVHASGVYAALQGATGVVAADVDVFHLRGYADLTPAELAVRGVTAAPLQPHIRIFPARPAPPFAQLDRFARAGFEGAVPPPVLAAEQAYLAEPATDIALTLVEAL